MSSEFSFDEPLSIFVLTLGPPVTLGLVLNMLNFLIPANLLPLPLVIRALLGLNLFNNVSPAPPVANDATTFLPLLPLLLFSSLFLKDLKVSSLSFANFFFSTKLEFSSLVTRSPRFSISLEVATTASIIL